MPQQLSRPSLRDFSLVTLSCWHTTTGWWEEKHTINTGNWGNSRTRTWLVHKENIYCVSASSVCQGRWQRDGGNKQRTDFYFCSFGCQPANRCDPVFLQHVLSPESSHMDTWWRPLIIANLTAELCTCKNDTKGVLKVIIDINTTNRMSGDQDLQAVINKMLKRKDKKVHYACAQPRNYDYSLQICYR